MLLMFTRVVTEPAAAAAAQMLQAIVLCLPHQ
jgi:hypothetical protein